MKLEKGDYITIRYVAADEEFELEFTDTREKTNERGNKITYYLTGPTKIRLAETNEVLKLFVNLGLAPTLTKLLESYVDKEGLVDKNKNVYHKKDEEMPEEFKAICDAFEFACDVARPKKKPHWAPGITITNGSYSYTVGTSKKSKYLFAQLKEKLGSICVAYGDDEGGYFLDSRNPQFIDKLLTAMTEVHQELSKNPTLNF